MHKLHQDALLYIWDISTGEVVFGQRLAVPVNVLQWVEHRMENRRYVYELVLGTMLIQNMKNFYWKKHYNVIIISFLGIGSNMNKGILAYDPVRVQWTLKMQAFTMPPGGGVVRYFHCLDLSLDKVFVFVGSSGIYLQLLFCIQS
jgi:hypothetical protein